MLKGIEWSDYFFVLGTLLVIYHSVVLALFYRKDIYRLFTSSKKSVRATENRST